MSRERQSVADLRATFESRSTRSPTPIPSASSPAITTTNTAANMSSAPKRFAHQLKGAVQPTIDAVLNASPAKLAPPAPSQSGRPAASTRPSWIGPKAPDRPVTPGASAMKLPVTVEFASPGLQPPVYICTSLSDPQWEPVEMEATHHHMGEYKFSMTFAAEEGEYQYKLRLGPGDWWVCDDTKPQVDDGMGNKNNQVIVKAEDRVAAAAPIPAIQEPVKDSNDSIDSVHDAPLMPHESPDQVVKPQIIVEDEQTVRTSADGEHHPAPLMQHETFAPEAAPGAADKEEDDEDEPESPPLLRHESVAPSSREQIHSPLFRHESTSIDDQQHMDDLRLAVESRGRNNSIPEEADLNDPSLQNFPTDHRAIIDHIERTKQSVPVDETSDEPGSPSSSRSPSKSPSSAIASVSPILESVREDDGEEPANDAPDGDVPRVEISDFTDRPAALITPPLTPKEEKNEQIEEATINRTVIEKAKHKAKAASKKVEKHVQETDYSAVFVGLGLAVAVAIAAVGIWYYKKHDLTVMDA